MKILFFVGGYGKRYGSEIVAMELIRYISSHYDVQYYVVTSGKSVINSFCEEFHIENMTVFFPMYLFEKEGKPGIDYLHKVWRLFLAEKYNYSAFKRIENLLDLEEFDLIQTNLSRNLIGGLIAKKHKIPHIWYIQEMVDAHYGMLLLKWNQIKWMNKHADRFVAVSKTVASDWIEHGLSHKKTDIVLNGVRNTCIIQKKEYTNDEQIKLVMVGNLCPEKGQMMVLEAMNALPIVYKDRFTLALFGGGRPEYEAELRSYADDHQLLLTMNGYQENVMEVLHEYEVGINCSKGEAFGLTTVEYMAAGLCVLVSDRGANTEIIRDHENGLIFNYGSIKSLSDRLCYLYDHYEERIRLSLTANKEAIQKYSSDIMCEKVYSLYTKILSMKSNGELP